MGIANISLLTIDNNTVGDILNDLDDVGSVRIYRGNLEYVYVGEEDIKGISLDIRNMRTKSYRICKTDGKYSVRIEV